MAYITVPGTAPNSGPRMVHEADTGDPACDTRGWTIRYDSVPAGFDKCPVCFGASAPEPEPVAEAPVAAPKPKSKSKRG